MVFFLAADFESLESRELFAVDPSVAAAVAATTASPTVVTTNLDDVDANDAALKYDLAWKARVYNGTADLGAYEYQPLPTPSLSVKSTTADSVALGWNAIANAKSYTLQYKKSGANDWMNVGIRGTETSYTLPGLSNTVYVFRLRANGDGGATCKSSEFSAICVLQIGSTSSSPTALDEIDDFSDLDDELLTALAEAWR